MSAIFKPMKPPTGTLNIDDVIYPCYGSIKYDGFRVAVRERRTILNSLRELDNVFTRKLLEAADVLNDHDGELVILPLNDNKCFNRCQSAFRAADGEPDFRFVVFDRITEGTFEERWVKFKKPKYPKWVIVDKPLLIKNRQELDAYVAAVVNENHEGVILRQPHGKYLFKRASFRSQELLRIKPMETREARIVDFECEYANINEACVDNHGHTKRSSAKAGKIAKDTLGKLICDDDRFGRISISGFSDDLADEIWSNKEKYRGELATYAYQEIGSIDAPRLAKFKGIRFQGDIS